MKVLARLRVPFGFLCAAVAFWLAQPTVLSLIVGAAVAVPGEALRIWAAGHISKGREVTTSGPYRYMRHPLYVGSAIMAVGFTVAVASVPLTGIALAYFVMFYSAAVRTEEATLDARFAGQYSAYRAGQAAGAERQFQWSQVTANREYRAAIGVVLAFAMLAMKL